MSEFLRAIILGVVQGLTEFLPVSSSGHIELVRYITNDPSAAEMGALMSVLLHFGTALATLIVFRKDIYDIFIKARNKDESSRKFIFYIGISMIPAAIIGVFFDDLIECLFDKKIMLVGFMLLITSGLLYFADRYTQEDGKLNFYKSLIIGIAQAIAILPGISRSGATISTSLLLNVNREEAARFSFLMVVPLIFGKILKDILDGSFYHLSDDVGALFMGFICALFAGIIACKWMLKIVQNAKLTYFAIYCFAVGIIAILVEYI